MVKELKDQTATHKYSCIDAVIAELKWWLMQMIDNEDYELQLSNLRPGIYIT